MNMIDNHLLTMPLDQLQAAAAEARGRRSSAPIEMCAIMNAKSGACTEDCAFCPQSCRHTAAVPVYPLQGPDEMVAQARAARSRGAERFSIVTSGPSLSREEVLTIRDGIASIVKVVGMRVCASLGSLCRDDLFLLKAAGLSRYHHNIETSRSFYPRIVSTHSFESRIRTIKDAQAVDLEVCSGGILGLGESMEDRVAMAYTLRELGVDAVPLNVLIPIQGTALEGTRPLGAEEILKTLALFRVIMPDTVIILAAGRESLDLREAFQSGANGIMIGDYLTTKGPDAANDRRIVEEVMALWKQTT
jgi:biotin synthase